MNPLEFVLGIVLTVFVFVAFLTRSANRTKQLTAESTPETLQVRDEMRAMKERIAVLERVITDNHGSLDLDRQIERLRDK